MSEAESTAVAVNGSQRADLQSDNGDSASRKEAYHAYLQSADWKRKRIAAIERAGDRCQVCNSPKKLHVHHRTYERVGHEAPGDLTVLCKKCHALFHDTGRKVKTKHKPISRATHSRCEGCGKNWTTKGLCKPCRRKPKRSRVQRINRGTIRMRALAKKCPTCKAPANVECTGIMRGLTHSERTT